MNFLKNSRGFIAKIRSMTTKCNCLECRRNLIAAKGRSAYIRCTLGGKKIGISDKELLKKPSQICRHPQRSEPTYEAFERRRSV